ncbi:MAG: hypothetical protein AB7R40_23950 [Nitrospiraceae bacterium]
MAYKKRKPAEDPGRIKIRLTGRRNAAELTAMMNEAGLRLAELNVPCLDKITIYATMTDKDGKILVPQRDRKPVTEITVENPYRSIAEDHGV